MKRIPLMVLESPTLDVTSSIAVKGDTTVRGPEDLVRMVQDVFKNEKREVFLCCLLSTKNSVRRIHVISIGSLNASIVHPREILRPAIRFAAASIILAHNHPSGNPSPSREDVEFTKRFAKCGELIGIQLLDHVIVGAEGHVSLKEMGVF